MSDIFVSRASIDMIEYFAKKGTPTENPCICMKFIRNGFEVSVSADSSHTANDLKRVDIRVFRTDEDVTDKFLHLFSTEEYQATMIDGSIDNLITVINAIDNVNYK